MTDTELDKLTVKVVDDTVTAFLYHAPKKNRFGITLILAHGAGGNQLSPFMRTSGSDLAKRGLDVMTFNFVYSEKRRGAPDRKDKLEACYSAIIDAAKSHKKLKGNALAIGGKSMGGRIASQVAAADQSLDLLGLVFLGYPLHPPGKPEQLRDAHLKDVRAPMLFIQGTRDPFGSPDELRSTIKKHKLDANLHLIEGGDHSFKVPKTSGPTQQQIHEQIMDFTSSWLNDLNGR
jgi:predicted alpha/beta-hydrolase family hydrolase